MRNFSCFQFMVMVYLTVFISIMTMPHQSEGCRIRFCQKIKDTANKIKEGIDKASTKIQERKNNHNQNKNNQKPQEPRPVAPPPPPRPPPVTQKPVVVVIQTTSIKPATTTTAKPITSTSRPTDDSTNKMMLMNQTVLSRPLETTESTDSSSDLEIEEVVTRRSLAAYLASSVRRSDWIESDENQMKWARQCEFKNGKTGGNLRKLKHLSDSNCRGACLKEIRCTHFNWFDNVCYLKALSGKRIKETPLGNPLATCGFVVKRMNGKTNVAPLLNPKIEQKEVEITNWITSRDGRVKLAYQCEFTKGGSHKRVEAEKEHCGRLCLGDASCTHFNWLGDTCYLKSFKGKDKVTAIKSDEERRGETLCGFIIKK